MAMKNKAYHTDKAPLTIGDALDERIAMARKNLETACINKARAEALDILDWPFDELATLLNTFPF